MADYYIRTPDREESRGPFDVQQLMTLAEADQITEDTLHYDETKEEWIPISRNEQLKADVFPKREKLNLKVTQPKKQASHANDEAQKEQEGLNVTDMLAAAECESEETSYLKKQEASFEKAASISASSIGLMILLSAVTLLVPHFTAVNQALASDQITTIINYPFIIIGMVDFLMAAFLFLGVTEIYSVMRARAMVTLGFGLYIGWALGDPMIMLASASAGVGIFFATISRSYSSMLLAIILGVGGHATLAYLSTTGHFAGCFDSLYFELIPAQ